LEEEKREATSGIKNNHSNATTTSPSQPNLEKDKVHKTVIDVNPQPHSEKDKVYKTILDVCDQNHYSSYDSVDVSDKLPLVASLFSSSKTFHPGCCRSGTLVNGEGSFSCHSVVEFVLSLLELDPLDGLRIES
jgi:hypothetical protein